MKFLPQCAFKVFTTPPPFLPERCLLAKQGGRGGGVYGRGVFPGSAALSLSLPFSPPFGQQVCSCGARGSTGICDLGPKYACAQSVIAWLLCTCHSHVSSNASQGGLHNVAVLQAKKAIAKTLLKKGLKSEMKTPPHQGRPLKLFESRTNCS